MIRAAACAGLAALLSACGQPAATETSPAATTSASATSAASPTGGQVEVVRDLVYLNGSTSNELNAAPKLMDVYLPAGGQGGPVVVLFHAAGFSKDGDREGPAGQQDALKDLAMAVAERGAVAFVPNWRNTDQWEDEPPDANRSLQWLVNDGEMGACAVSYALAHATEYGADPGTLILVGRSAGSNVAAEAGLGQPTPLPECAVPLAQFVADGMVLWEGDWLFTDIGYDTFGPQLSLLLDAATPWSRLATGPTMPIDLVDTIGFRQSAFRCGIANDSHDPYFALRDPAGTYRLFERFAAIGAIDDGCIDGGEIDLVLGQAMQDAGLDANVMQLEHGDHGDLGEDQPLIVAEILAIADR
jgi:hypothetical protein